TAMLPLFPDPGAIGRREPSAKPPIAVIGAGFSGTLATLHLIRRLPPDQPVLLVERSEHFARGIAYATGDADHLLNVRAANMSAL
ncbi:FAD/NAD(P)-binding protein, partial [Vibrio parahaemolyticus]